MRCFVTKYGFEVSNNGNSQVKSEDVVANVEGSLSNLYDYEGLVH